MLEKVGMPDCILAVIRDFYWEQQRYFEVDVCCCPKPANVRRSLLQGCPWSMVLLAALNTLWMKANEHIDGKHIKADIFAIERAGGRAGEQPDREKGGGRQTSAAPYATG